MKIAYWECEGVRYPLVDSISVEHDIMEKYGNEDDINALIKKPCAKTIDLMIDQAFFMIKSGIEYCKLKKETYDLAPIDPETGLFFCPERKYLALILDAENIDTLKTAIMDCQKQSAKTEVKTVPVKKKVKKNARS